MEIDIRHIRIVDINEPPIIRDQLLAMGWVQQRLVSADYSFYTCNFKKVGVERKTIQDLINGLGERLIRQLYNMIEHYEFPILLLEGNWRTLMPAGQLVTDRGVERWGRKLVWNFLRTWQHRGISLEITANEAHTVVRLNELYAYYQKPIHTGGVNRKIVGDKRLLCFPEGIGIKLAEKVLAKMGSLRNVANASIEELLQCEGIGKQRAEAIVAFYNKKIGGQNERN